MKFDGDREEREFADLDPRAQAIALWLDHWLAAKGWPELTVTSVLRTPAEQVAIYGYARPSPHVDGRALDFRVRDYSPTQIQEIDRVVSEAFAQLAGGVMDVCLVHDVGAGLHGHVQVSKPRRKA